MLVVLSIQVYQPDILQACGLQKTDVGMINNAKVTLMRVSSASMQLVFYAHGCPKIKRQ